MIKMSNSTTNKTENDVYMALASYKSEVGQNILNDKDSDNNMVM
jgi:hypothetical protein